MSFFFPGLHFLSASFSLIERRNFSNSPSFFNHEYGDFSILNRVTYFHGSLKAGFKFVAKYLVFRSLCGFGSLI